MCPPCKIILDDPGVLAASAYLLAETIGPGTHVRAIDRSTYANARYLARIATASANAVMRGIDSGLLDAEQVDEAHAWSELSCHRASAIRAHVASLVGDLPTGEVEPPMLIDSRLLMQWAEEQRLFTTKLIGGEYNGAWIVDGTEGIRPKE